MPAKFLALLLTLILTVTIINKRGMNSKVFYSLIAAFFIGLFSYHASAQKGVEDGSRFGHGEDSIRCIRNLSLSREYARNKAYNDALPFWRTVYNECPRASKNIYIDGVKIFSHLIENEQDKETQMAYLDTLMNIYDQRIEYYKQRGFVLGRKGIDLLRYNRTSVDAIQEAYGYLSESMELEKTKTSNATLATLFTSSIALYKAGVFDESNVVEDYARIMENIDSQLAKQPNNKRLLSVQKIVEDNFVGSGAANCNALISLYTPKYEANPEDIDLLKNILNFLDQTGCKDEQLFFDASASLHNLEPSALSASSMASMSIEKENFDLAYDYFKQAIELETDDDKKADYYYSLGIIANKRNDLAEAREHAQQAAELRADWGEPYILIGNLYAKSLDLCSDLTLPKSVFWVAVDKFIQAKNVDPDVASKADDLINTYSPYFPNKEDAFFHNIIEGSTYNVGCWINENTTVRF